MILQTLDIKDNCKGIYLNDRVILEPNREHFEQVDIAWKHSPMLEDENFFYLYPCTGGKDLSFFSSFPDRFQASVDKISAHKRALQKAKVNLDELCFFDTIPEHQLIKFYRDRNQALEELFKNTTRGRDYDILHKAHVLTTNISHQHVLFGGARKRVVYDIFGSATGRLTTKKGSVPVMTLRKTDRSLLKPLNDLYVELDLNAAEARMLLALSGHSQPEEDFHMWIANTVLGGKLDRPVAKQKFFAWLYNPSASNNQFAKFFSREIFRDFYFFDEEVLTTPFGRKLTVKERKAQNYLLQSSTSDQVIENAYKIQRLLKNKKSNIAFTLHDSIVLDMSREDAIMLKEIRDQFESTRWGKFKSTCSIGKDFGNLKEIQI